MLDACRIDFTYLVAGLPINNGLRVAVSELLGVFEVLLPFDRCGNETTFSL